MKQSTPERETGVGYLQKGIAAQWVLYCGFFMNIYEVDGLSTW